MYSYEDVWANFSTEVQVPLEARRGSWIPWTGLTGGCELPTVSVASQTPVQGQHVLLTPELSLRPLYFVVNGEI